MGSYLTTSAAASTYAPIASPTFTGTVTIPAGASISGFAPLASPVFTGVPEAPTAAATTNTTQVATTAFVQQEVPAASTTAAGKVELATDAEAVAGTSATLAVTPSNLRYNYRPGWLIPDPTATTAVVSTGTTFASPSGLNLRLTATAAGQFAIRYYGTAGLTVLGWSIGTTATSCDFSRPFKMGALAWISGTANPAIHRVKFAGGGNPTAPGDLAVKGLAIRIVDGGAVELQVHDGTTLTNVASSFTPTASTPFRWIVEADGTGNAALYIDSGSGLSSVATTTAAPTGASTFYPTLITEQESTAAYSGSSFFNNLGLGWYLG
jgi:hypothetical protein